MREILRRVKGLEKASGAKDGPFTILFKDELGILRDSGFNIMVKDERGVYRDETGAALSAPSSVVVLVSEALRPRAFRDR